MTEFLNILNMVVVFFVAYHYARNVYKKRKFNQAMDDTHKSFEKRVISTSRYNPNDPFGVNFLYENSGLDVVKTGSGGNNG